MCTTASSSTSSVEGYLLFQFPQTHLQPNGQTTSIFSASATILPSLALLSFSFSVKEKKNNNNNKWIFLTLRLPTPPPTKTKRISSRTTLNFHFFFFLKKKGEKCALVTYIPNNYVFIVCILNFELAYCLNTIQGILEVNNLRVLDDTQFVFYLQKLILKIWYKCDQN